MYNVGNYTRHLYIGRACSEERCEFDKCIGYFEHDKTHPVCHFIQINPAYMLELIEFLGNKFRYPAGSEHAS